MCVQYTHISKTTFAHSLSGNNVHGCDGLASQVHVGGDSLWIAQVQGEAAIVGSPDADHLAFWAAQGQHAILAGICCVCVNVVLIITPVSCKHHGSGGQCKMQTSATYMYTVETCTN